MKSLLSEVEELKTVKEQRDSYQNLAISRRKEKDTAEKNLNVAIRARNDADKLKNEADSARNAAEKELAELKLDKERADRGDIKAGAAEKKAVDDLKEALAANEIMKEERDAALDATKKAEQERDKAIADLEAKELWRSPDAVDRRVAKAIAKTKTAMRETYQPLVNSLCHKYDLAMGRLDKIYGYEKPTGSDE